MPSKANQVNEYSNCCGGATRARLLSPKESPHLSQLQLSSYAPKTPGEAPCQSRISGRSLSGASRWPVGAASSRPRCASSEAPLLLLQLGQLVLGARAEAGDVEDSVYSSVYSAVCAGVDSRMASVCSNFKFVSRDCLCWRCCCLWSLLPACHCQLLKNANQILNQIEHIFMNTKHRLTKIDATSRKNQAT